MSCLYVLSAFILHLYVLLGKGMSREIAGARNLRTPTMDGIEYLGLVASSLATLSFLPQVIRTWRTRSAQDFSLTTLLMLEAGTILWIVYGLSRGAPAIWLGNAVTFTLVGFILWVKASNLRSARSIVG